MEAARSTKGKVIGYWICTGMIVFTIGSGGVLQALAMKQNVEGLAALGYPLHFVIELGVWKALGALALLVPKFPRLKEWAYAGIFFDLSGASIAALSNHAAAFHVIAPLVLIGFLVGSWALRPASRRLS